VSAAANEREAVFLEAWDRATPGQRGVIYAMICTLAEGRGREAALCAEVLAHDAGQVADPAILESFCPGYTTAPRD
jgi:hypothetical protein